VIRETKVIEAEAEREARILWVHGWRSVLEETIEFKGGERGESVLCGCGSEIDQDCLSNQGRIMACFLGKELTTRIAMQVRPSRN